MVEINKLDFGDDFWDYDGWFAYEGETGDGHNLWEELAGMAKLREFERKDPDGIKYVGNMIDEGRPGLVFHDIRFHIKAGFKKYYVTIADDLFSS